MTTLDEFSLTAVPLEPYFNETKLGNATGFMWEWAGAHYLVTNWHVVSARDFFTDEYLDRVTVGRPNKLRTLFNTKMGFIGKQQWDISIRDEDDNPLWLVHPGRRLDIAVLPLPVNAEHPVSAFHPINRLTDARVPLQIGMEVFILGFPFGAEPPGYPVWKRGSIASEPDLARLTTDYLLVDTASRPGMSGAPVIRRNRRFAETAEERSSVAKPSTRFVGIYSGRLRTQTADEAQIGLVWDASFINEIIAGNTRDT